MNLIHFSNSHNGYWNLEQRKQTRKKERKRKVYWENSSHIKPLVHYFLILLHFRKMNEIYSKN